MVDYDSLAKELYDMSKLGAASLPSFLHESMRRLLLREIKRSNSFARAPRKYKNALQEFDCFYLGEADKERAKGDFPALFSFRDSHANFCRELSAAAKFSTRGYPNSMEIKRYEKGSLGLTPHMDESKCINLISIFTLEGDAPFCIYKDDRRTVLSELDFSPGSLILIRAPRTRAEQ